MIGEFNTDLEHKFIQINKSTEQQSKQSSKVHLTIFKKKTTIESSKCIENTDKNEKKIERT